MTAIRKNIDQPIRCCLTGIMLTAVFLLAWGFPALPQEPGCPGISNKKAEKIFEKAVRAYRQYDYRTCISLLNDVIDEEPEYTDAWFMLGLVYIDERRMNLKAARRNFEEVIRLCPDYDPYVYFHLARIAYGAEEYDVAHEYISVFLEDVDRIRTDADYNEAVAIQDYSSFYRDILGNPVPFDPKPVQGISTSDDEYLPIISPDNELALFTRRLKIPPRRDDITPQAKYKERFMVSERVNGSFSPGTAMPPPFNMNDNEGGATLTIDNKELFYTLCQYTSDNRYYNCDICYSRKKFGTWSDIRNLGNEVNQDNTWESQPSVTSDGKTLYFVSDRPGGYGGYDIYKTMRDSLNNWGRPVNLGPVINTSGNEKSPFIHTDSQTLYFSSDGRMGLGGYDIFFARLDTSGRWSEPVNIGHPINSMDDDVGFFVSTDGHYGYFASNKFDGLGGWDLYFFDLYEEARPEKVLFVKGKVSSTDTSGFTSTRVQLRNVASRKVKDIPVDTLTGKYVAAVLFRDDYVLTIKQKGFVNESRYLARVDPKNAEPLDFPIDLKPIEVGTTYRLNDVYFAFNAFDLPGESKTVIEEFSRFLQDNPSLKVSIEGHTDDVGSEDDNLLLSQRRSKAVYDYLVQLGIESTRLSYKGYGESRPIAGNETEEGRAKNRRTEFVIVQK